MVSTIGTADHAVRKKECVHNRPEVLDQQLNRLKLAPCLFACWSKSQPSISRYGFSNREVQSGGKQRREISVLLSPMPATGGVQNTGVPNQNHSFGRSLRAHCCVHRPKHNTCCQGTCQDFRTEAKLSWAVGQWHPKIDNANFNLTLKFATPFPVIKRDFPYVDPAISLTKKDIAILISNSISDTWPHFRALLLSDILDPS